MSGEGTAPNEPNAPLENEPVPVRSTKNAVYALWLSLSSVLCLVTAVPGLILGILGLREARRTGNGQAASIAAVSISSVMLVVVVAAFAVASTTSSTGSQSAQGDTGTLNSASQTDTGASPAESPTTTPSPVAGSSMVGVVTGYEGGDGSSEQVVMVNDSIAVDLDLIATLNDLSCNGDYGKLQDAAIKAKKRLLPLGQRVLIVWSEAPFDIYEGTQGLAFVHLLPDGADTPSPAPPAMSVNEQLVATGYWAPYGVGISSPGEYKKQRFRVVGVDGINAVQRLYAPLLVKAGNKARIAQVGGQKGCVGKWDTFAQEQAYLRAQFKKSLEDDRRRHANAPRVYCIDGDGDGICFED